MRFGAFFSWRCLWQLPAGLRLQFFSVIPPIRESIRLALNEGGYIFVWAVIVPSGIFSA